MCEEVRFGVTEGGRGNGLRCGSGNGCRWEWFWRRAGDGGRWNRLRLLQRLTECREGDQEKTHQTQAGEERKNDAISSHSSSRSPRGDAKMEKVGNGIYSESQCDDHAYNPSSKTRGSSRCRVVISAVDYNSHVSRTNFSLWLWMTHP